MSFDPLDTATAAPDVAPALALDERQRAMLEAMGIQLWQPGFYKQKKPLAQQNIAQAATKSGAIDAPAGAGHRAHAQAPSDMQGPADAAQPAPTAARVAAPAAPAAQPAKPSAAPSESTVALQPLPAGIERMDWLQLQTAVSTCQACALCAGRKNTVFGVGQPSAEPALAPRADWLIIGEAPGENEDLQGEPFVGQAGKLLDNMLRAMRIDGKPLGRHSNVFISNVLKCRPPANRNPSADEVAMCQPYLLRQIALLQPKIILAMGRFAVQALTGSTEPLGKLRGRVHALQGSSYAAPVIVTYHPAYLLRNLPDKAKAWADLLLAMETLQSGAASSGVVSG
jgi:uracil-DNA glycosylase